MPMLKVVQLYIAPQSGFGMPSVGLRGEDLVNGSLLLAEKDLRAFVHASLLYNLCGSVTPEDSHHKYKLKRVIDSLTMELDVAAAGGMQGVVVHSGSHKNRPDGALIARETLKTALVKETPFTVRLSKDTGISVSDIVRNRKILLENCAGEGTKLGRTIDEMVELLPDAPRGKIGVCWDTAHSYGCGEYDLGDAEGVVKFWEDVNSTKVPIEAIHFNDSKTPFATCRDLHAVMGEGQQFATGVPDEWWECVRTYSPASLMGETVPLISESPGPAVLDYLFLTQSSK